MICCFFAFVMFCIALTLLKNLQLSLLTTQSHYGHHPVFILALIISMCIKPQLIYFFTRFLASFYKQFKLISYSNMLNLARNRNIFLHVVLYFMFYLRQFTIEKGIWLDRDCNLSMIIKQIARICKTKNKTIR